MRIVGVDLGERRVGLAVWDEPLVPARPLATVEVTAHTLVARVAAAVKSAGATELVVGLPLRLDGRAGLAARHARTVAAALGKATGLPVSLLDERLTTKQATTARHAAGKRGREGIDAHAAAILLQTFVDTRAAAWRRRAGDEEQ